MNSLAPAATTSDTLEGKVALVTGGARGQGASHAEALARAGATVVAVDVLDDEGGRRAEELAGQGLAVEYAHLDVTDAEQWRGVVAGVADRHGGLDVLVNNAGIIHVTPVVGEDLASWHHLLDVNLTGPLLGIREAVPVMRGRGGGSVINVGSIFGVVGAVGYAAYTASKAGLIGLTKTAALELAEHRIRVNAISPGGVATPMNEQEKDGGVIPETPLGRRAHVTEVSSAVVFLASPSASFVTGTNLVVDGGFLAH